MEVGDDADDGFDATFISVLELLPYGVFVGPVFPGEGLIDESYIGRVRDVFISEVAPTQNRDSEQPQVTRCNAHPLA